MVARKKQIAELKSKDEPTVVVGSHLTVITHPNGKTELLWDDAALLRDVQNALTDYENSVKVTVTETKKSKAPKKQK
jgi:hypothetical protein